MKILLTIISLALLLLLPACSTSTAQRPVAVEPAVADETGDEESFSVALPAPDLYRKKDGKTLKLVRILEGGACQDENKGAVGMFMLYADPDDIERVKKTKGEKVFAEFEQVIEEFAMLALQQAVNELEFSDDPFALDDEDVQKKLAEQLKWLFDASVADAVTEFESATSLTIDLVPLPDSLYFYLDGCELPHH